MVQPIDEDELIAAWRALAGQEGGEGWQSIPIASWHTCNVLAARKLPGKEEALLVSFSEPNLDQNERLPSGHGFTLQRIKPGPSAIGQTWYALTRQSAGSVQLFTVLACDLLLVLASTVSSNEAHTTFIQRLWAWLAFMKRSPEGVLGREAEIGLFGELCILQRLFDAELPGKLAISAWTGPMESPQDFTFKPGAIEVKTIVSPARLQVMISSLEQLDNMTTSPLYLAVLSIANDADGLSLPMLVASIREKLRELPDTQNLFESHLAHAGYLESMAHRYSNCFSENQLRIYLVDSSFPRLTRSSQPTTILEVQYKVDLDQLNSTDLTLNQTLQELKVQ